jgi:hypothetical protein
LFIFTLINVILLIFFFYRRKLKRLNLGGNELVDIPTSSLSSLNMLKKLEMQENHISTIKVGDFQGIFFIINDILS